MSPSLALTVWAAGVLGLFYLDRERGATPSKALWLPTLWLLINGSRPVTMWLGMQPAVSMQQQIMDGTPADAAVFGVLLALGLVVVWRRRRLAGAVLRQAWPVLIYFGYCLASVLWSNIADVAAKRWVKSLGDLAMVLVVATEPDLALALRRLFSRTAILLLPASILFIRYFPALGRSFDPWSGAPTNVGVTTNKNILGAVAFLLALGALWQVLSLASEKLAPGRRRRLLAQFAILVVAVFVLQQAHSATSISAALFGGALILATLLPMMRRPAMVHAIVAFILVGGLLAFWLGAEGAVTHELGRKSDLTGRTEIWHGVLAQAALSPIVGVGFESFWTGPNLLAVSRRLPHFEGSGFANEAHDGYIEVYAEVGMVGLTLIIGILVGAYRRAVRAFALNPMAGRLMLGYVAALAIYNITEAGFRMLSMAWIFLLLAVICAARIVCQAQSAPLESPAAQAQAMEVPA
ncbi:MAG TPA: O-antigen ligase family protein [Terriglobales bacterium]|nr:O-antigen ligase family protein [Terriglobales bacterium]